MMLVVWKERSQSSSWRACISQHLIFQLIATTKIFMLLHSSQTYQEKGYLMVKAKPAVFILPRIQSNLKCSQIISENLVFQVQRLVPRRLSFPFVELPTWNARGRSLLKVGDFVLAIGLYYIIVGVSTALRGVNFYTVWHPTMGAKWCLAARLNKSASK